MEASKETQRGLEAIRPLEQSEADGATKAAMSLLKERAGIDRLVPYGAEIHVEKPPRDQTPSRQVRVRLGATATGLVYDVMVDASGRVIAIQERPGFQPPFLDSEVNEARAIAERNVDLGDALDGRTLTLLTFAPGGSQTDRRVGLHYVAAAQNGAAVSIAIVEVNLTRGRLERFERK
jgi:hypothetical protein